MSDCTHVVVLEDVTRVCVIDDDSTIIVTPDVTRVTCTMDQSEIIVRPDETRVCVSPIAVLQQSQIRVVEVVSLYAVPSNGTLYLGSPPTSAAPLVVPSISTLDTLTLSVDKADSVAWDLEVQDALTLAVLATLTLTAGDVAESASGLGVALTQNQQLLVRLRGTKRSAFANARATIETTRT